MDSGTTVAAGIDSRESGARRTGYVATTMTPYVAPIVRIRASPSLDDDDDFEIDSDYAIDEAEDEGGAGRVDVNGRKEFNGSSSFRILSSLSSSEDEVEDSEEGGFLSGEEDFLVALERPYVADEEEEEEGVNVAFVEPFESLRPIAKLSEDVEDDGSVEVNASESDDEVALRLGIHNDAIDVDIADEVGSTIVTKPPVGEGLLEVDGVKFTAGGSVVESINVDVNVAEPGVVVVEDVKPAVVPSWKEANTKEDSKLEEREIDKEFSDEQAEIAEKDVNEDMSMFVTPSNDDLTIANGMKLTSEGDADIEAIQVDLQEPRVVVVNGSEEITNFPEIEEKDDILVSTLTEEGSSSVDSPARDEILVVSGEGDSEKNVNIVEQIKSSVMKGDEVHVNGRSIYIDEDKPLAGKLEDEVVMEDGLDITTKGESVVEAINLSVSEPGVVVVEVAKEGEKPDVKAVENYVGEAVELLKNELDETSGAVNVEGGVSCSDDDQKHETGIDQVGVHDEVTEADQYAQAFVTSNSDDLDQEVSRDDEIRRLLEEAHDREGSASDDEDADEADDMIFGSSEAAKQFLDELEQRSVGGSHSGVESSRDHSQIDGQIATDSDEEADSDEEGSGKQLFDSAALAALLKAAAAGSSGSNVTLSSQDVSNLFSVKHPAGLVSSLRARPAPRRVQPNLFSSSSIAAREELSQEEKKKLEGIQQLRVKFLRLVYILDQSPEDLIAAQVLNRLDLVAGSLSSQVPSLQAAKRTAQELENHQSEDNLNFCLNILVIGKSGVGKSATINSIFGENKTGTNTFEPSTTYVKEITGVVDGVRIRVLDTPGLKTSVVDQGSNMKILGSIKKAIKKCPLDIVLYVDRLDMQTRDLDDLPLLRTITSSLGPTIWRSAIVTLTHAASSPPDGPSGIPLSYEVFVARRSRAVQHSIGQAVGDLPLMNPNMMNPVSLAENHPSCRKNRDGQKVLLNGQAWRPQLLMFCYSMKILSEASALCKQQDQFDHQKLFGFRMRAPPLQCLLSWLLQPRTHPKLAADQGGDDGDSDIDLNDFSESEAEEEEDEYDQLPPFKPLQKFQLAKLDKEQLKAYHEEYNYRVKLLQKKTLKEELKRLKEMKKRKVPESEFLGGDEADPENGDPASVPVPLPDMVLPPSFDCDNPAYRYRFLEPSSQLIARPVLDNHGWDHDCGYDGVNLEQSLAIASRFPAAITVQLTKDKKEFNVHLDSSVAAKHGDNKASSMAGFDIQNIGKKLAYIVRGETKFKNLKKNKTTAGFSVTFLGENIATGVKIEDQLAIGKRLVLIGSTGTVRSQRDAAYGANLEIKLRDSDFPIGQDQSSLGLSLVKWRGELALGAILRSQFSVGHGSNVAVRLGLNNKSTGQITLRTNTSDQLQVALVGFLTVLLGVYRAVLSGVGDD